MKNLNDLDNLLTQLIDAIDRDENVHCGDVYDILDMIDILYLPHKMLYDAYDALYRGLYVSRGAMSGVQEEIHGFMQASLQQRCYYYLIESA